MRTGWIAYARAMEDIDTGIVQPRHVVCALGTWTSFAAIERLLAERGGAGFELDMEYSQLEPDPRMVNAFAASADRVDPSVSDTDRAAIRDHRAVAYVLSPSMPRPLGQTVSRQMLAIVSTLIDAGAVAIKSESAGVAHGIERWRELAAAAASGTPLDRAAAMRRAWVRRPIKDGNILYSCGMHLLGERDVEVSASADVFDDLRWMDLLAMFLLAEKPELMEDGEGFRLSDDGERRILRARPCDRYAADDFMHNPYGYWRLESAGRGD